MKKVVKMGKINILVMALNLRRAINQIPLCNDLEGFG